MLLTRSPLEYPASRAFPFDLHVLSTPPAFVLSQDQTLHKKISEQQHPKTKAVKSPNLTKTNHHKPHKKQAHAGIKKLLQRKNKQPPPTRQGTKRRGTKVEHNHMPTNPSMQPKHQTVFKKMRIPTPHRHTPTNKPPQGSLANRPINTQPCTQKQKISTLAHY